MDSRTIGRVALISIHPEYAEAILSGEKRVEFRKKPIARDVTHVVLYATKPVSAVVGAFSVDGQQAESPDRLWDRFSGVAGIERAKFEAYFDSQATGIGIRVGEVYRVHKQLPLQDALGLKRAPQSFQYLERERALSLLQQTEISPELKLAEEAPYQSRIDQLELQPIAD